jgi:hypothetical protein
MERPGIAKWLGLVFALGLLLWAAAACGTPEAEPPDDFVSPAATEAFESPLAPSATLPPLVLEPGSGGAKGVLVAYPPDWEGSELIVYLAPFYAGDEGDEGIFVLEPGVHPSVDVGPGGAFQLGTIPPGQYVVVIGPGPEGAQAVQGADRPEVFEIVAGEILEIGEIALR